ncbi:guanylate kinase [hydrocarbon metagenome]|uniref:Guanylate kinase n=1 Tax=hydrocarbon metagenome TaxID=938273 RepID=A0A0W8E1G2_9ZZZZ
MEPIGRLVVLSGPSCVGKGPLCNALQTFYPELYGNLHRLVLYNSRDPRPGERDGIDYHFRSREEIIQMKNRDDFILLEVRGDLQGLDVGELLSILRQGQDVLFEGNPFIPRALWTSPQMSEIPMLKVFLSPVSRREILWLKSHDADLPGVVSDAMRRKLLRRTQRQKGILSYQDLENIKQRSNSAPDELRLACQFDWVIPNHDGEDSENWTAFKYPVGDAFRALQTFVSILQGEEPFCWGERWEQELF